MARNGTLTFSHVDGEGALADLATCKGDVDSVLALLGGFVGAAVAAVALVLNVAGHRVLLACRVHDDHLHLPHTSA